MSTRQEKKMLEQAITVSSLLSSQASIIVAVYTSSFGSESNIVYAQNIREMFISF